MAQQRGFTGLAGIGVGACFALFVAAIGVVLDLQGAPEAYQRFGYAVSSLAAAAAYLAVGYCVAWAAGTAVGFAARGWSAPVTFGLAATLGVYTTFTRVFGAYQVPLPTRGDATLALCILSFLLGLGLLASMRRSVKEELWSRALAVSLPAALATLAVAAVLWQLRFGGAVWGWAAALAFLALAAFGPRLSPALKAAVAGGVLALVLAGGVANWRMERSFSPTNQLGGVDGKIPRVVLVTIDTLRADSLAGRPKSERPATPNLDAFAAESYVFERAISSGAWTPPGMSSLLTGLDPMTHGVGMGRGKLPAEIPTLPERMASAGYQVAGAGLNPIVRSTGLVDRWSWIHWHPYFPTPESIGNFLLTGAVPFYEWNPSTAELTDWALAWMRANYTSEFYFWLHFYDPHVPYSPPGEFVDRSLQTARIGPVLDIESVERVRVGAPMVDAADRKWMRELYDAEVSYVDQNVGRLFATLRELGVYEDSLIIVTSDHGEEFFDHGGYEHGQNLYNELLHVPLMVRPPGGVQGQVVSDVVATASVTPTILDLTGIEYDAAELTYPPLSPYLGGVGEPQETPVFSSGVRFFENWVSVVFAGH